MSNDHGKRLAAGLVSFGLAVITFNLLPMTAAHWVSAILAAVAAYWQLPDQSKPN